MSNFCASNKDLERDVIIKLCETFEVVLAVDLSECANKVFIAMPETRKDVIDVAGEVSKKPTDSEYTLLTMGRVKVVPLQLRALKHKIAKFSDSDENIREMVFNNFKKCSLLNLSS